MSLDYRWHVVRLRRDRTRRPVASKTFRDNAVRLAEALVRLTGDPYLVVDPTTGSYLKEMPMQEPDDLPMPVDPRTTDDQWIKAVEFRLAGDPYAGDEE